MKRDMSDIEPIEVEVAYAEPEKQKIIQVLVPPGSTAYDAVLKSGMTKLFPSIDVESVKIGVFGQTLGSKGQSKLNDYILKAGDRVEIYRPLIADPKEVRRKRAEEAKARQA